MLTDGIWIVLCSPLFFVFAWLVSFFQPGIRPGWVKKVSRIACWFSFPVAGWAVWLVIQRSVVETIWFSWEGLGFSIRLDALSVSMLTMIVLLSFIIVRFSHTYLEGDSRHGTFLGRLCATIAAVELLVLAGNLGLLFFAWVATSLLLHQLLVFYPDRPGAVIAGYKKFIAARSGDLCLLGASGLLYWKFGTGQFEALFHQASQVIQSGEAFGAVHAAGVLIALTALLKSAQFPTHGWLVEVMETPTPVSALLHAGILNAGPFLVVRLAHVVHGSFWASFILITAGGFTALFASTVLLTQPAIKVALGYSSAAHMGFMLLVCGMGVYPAAILHLIAHSFYKAHAFLSSGSVVDEGKAEKVALPRRQGNPLWVGLSIVLGGAIYLGFSLLWGINPLVEPARLAVGLILVLGLAQILTPAIDSDGPWIGSAQTFVLAVAVATHFFLLEMVAHRVLDPVMPHGPLPGDGIYLTSFLVVAIFSIVVFIQLLGPRTMGSNHGKRWAVHLRNGFYANALFDRWVGAFDKTFRDACHRRAKKI